MRAVHRILGGVLALTLLGSAALVAADPSAAAKRPIGPGVLRTWAAQYADRSPSVDRATALLQASEFDLLFAKADVYTPYLAEMRAVNPRLKIFAYMSVPAQRLNSPTDLPDSWLLRDETGAYVKQNRFDKYILDVANPDVVTFRVNQCKALLASSKYDGCGLDVLGIAPVSAPFGPTGFVSAPPVNPRTGLVWDPKDWLAATSAIAKATGIATGKPVLGNGLSKGFNYFDPRFPTSVLFDGVDIGMAEGFMRVGRSDINLLPTYDFWKQDIDMIVDAEAKGHAAIVTAKTFTTGTQAQKDRWHALSLASFLLGANGGSMFSFQYDELAEPTDVHPWWSTQLGDPNGPYEIRKDGGFQRMFQLGRAVVNPTAAPITVRFATPRKNLYGVVATRFVLQPWEGDVYVKP